MDRRRTYADHRCDAARLRAGRDTAVTLRPSGPSLGLAGLDLPAADEVTAAPEGQYADPFDGPAVTNLDCESETPRVDGRRIAISKVVTAADWPAGTSVESSTGPRSPAQARTVSRAPACRQRSANHGRAWCNAAPTGAATVSDLERHHHG